MTYLRGAVLQKISEFHDTVLESERPCKGATSYNNPYTDLCHCRAGWQPREDSRI